jgi:hypothetical protein
MIKVSCINCPAHLFFNADAGCKAPVRSLLPFALVRWLLAKASSGPVSKMLPLLFVAAVGSFAQKVQMESDQTVDFSKFKTFSIQSGRLTSADPSLNNELIQKQLEADIQKQLEAKGLNSVPSGDADLHVRYTLGTPRGVETEVYPAGWRGWGTRVVKVPYTEGTLVIDLRDTHTRSLVWRAIVRDEQSKASKLESKLSNMVQQAINKYPPRTSSGSDRHKVKD